LRHAFACSGVQALRVFCDNQQPSTINRKPSNQLSPVDSIARKRDGEALSDEAIHRLIAAYTDGNVPDYQMSAFLMAAYLRGLSDDEAAALTDAMLHSGEVLDLSDAPGAKIDKHSTGGVGDSVSLILAPLVAACGVPVPMISGRGLGHTGGTLDKLESIPGLRTDLSTREYRRQLERIGLVMIGQTAEIAPADGKLYALRDVTATVESIPLIAASIMSKKLAEGIDALVLDVKCGSGAFMKTEPDARRLAETLVGVGRRAETPSVALLTRMETPLGRAVGNWPEVAESIRCLRGDEDDSDLMTVTLALAGEMLALGEVADTPEAGREQAREAIADGSAFDKLVEMTEAQGGDVSVLHDLDARPKVPKPITVRAPDGAGGYVAGLDALAVGRLSVALGAGRQTKEDDVDPTAGLVLEKRLGDAARPGEPMARLFTRATDDADFAERLQDAFAFSEEPPDVPPVLMDRYDGENGWGG
jgi:pyrimidine-nucleoside phosphorylase